MLPDALSKPIISKLVLQYSLDFLMNSVNEIEKNVVSVCIDICHKALSQDYNNAQW